MKKNRTMIGTLIAVILIILLLNPQWLPVSMETREKIRDLEKSYFLIERSGRITVAHILTVLLMTSVLWVINVVVKWIIQYFSKKSLRAQTIGDLLAGTFHYLIVIVGVVSSSLRGSTSTEISSFWMISGARCAISASARRRSRTRAAT